MSRCTHFPMITALFISALILTPAARAQHTWYIDDDGDTAERTPLDLDGLPRFVNDPWMPDSGIPDPPDYLHVVDVGAYEPQRQWYAIPRIRDQAGPVRSRDLQPRP